MKKELFVKCNKCEQFFAEKKLDSPVTPYLFSIKSMETPEYSYAISNLCEDCVSKSVDEAGLVATATLDVQSPMKNLHRELAEIGKTVEDLDEINRDRREQATRNYLKLCVFDDSDFVIDVAWKERLFKDK